MTRPAGEYLGGGIRLPVQPAQRLELVPFRFNVGRTPVRIVGDSARRVAVTIVPNGPCDLIVSDSNDTARGQLVPGQGSDFHTSSELWAWSSGGPDYAADWGNFDTAVNTNGELISSPDWNTPTFLAGASAGWYAPTYAGTGITQTNSAGEQGAVVTGLASVASAAFPVPAGKAVTFAARAIRTGATGNIDISVFYGNTPNFDVYQAVGPVSIASVVNGPAAWTNYTASLVAALPYARIVCTQWNAAGGSAAAFRQLSAKCPGGVPTGSHAVHDTLTILGDTEGTITVTGGQLSFDATAGATPGQSHTMIINTGLVLPVDTEVELAFDYTSTGAATATASLVFVPSYAAPGYPRRTLATEALTKYTGSNQQRRNCSLVGQCSQSTSAVISDIGDQQFTRPDAGTTWTPMLIIVLAPYASAGTLLLDNLTVRPTRCIVTGQEHHA